MINNQRKITILTRFSYGSGNLIGSGALAISAAWLLYFYTTFCGLSVFEATLIFSIATYLDVILNPLMGFITDNFYQNKLGRRFGRRRFFILLAIPCMIIYPMLWINGMSFWYYLTTYILFEIIYTMIMIPYNTLPVEMTKNFDQRTYLAGSKAMFGKVANFLAAAIPGLFFYLFHGNNSPTPFLFTGITYATIMAIALILLYCNSWEKRIDEVENESTEGLIEGVKKLFLDVYSTFRLKTFRNHLGMYLFGFGAEWLFAATFTYFIVFNLGQPRAFVSEMNSLSSICQLISTAFFMVWCAKHGFKRPFVIAILIVISSVIGYVGVFHFNLPHITWIVVAITIWFGLGTGGVYYIPWSVYTFLADIDEVLTGRRREGIYAGAMTMAGKLMRATVVFILGLVLSHFGFKSGILETQPDSAINAINGVMLFGVCGMAILGIIFTYRMKLDKSTHALIIKELERVKNGGSKEQATPEIRKLVKELTGFDYNCCFGNNNVGFKAHK
ncbi:MFS transporter [Orbus wheelerorum]|uniref:MFS transporter n=1 Tax=Orbus wheelerorum TaxID=3074111 RepID=UPI00370D6A73